MSKTETEIHSELRKGRKEDRALSESPAERPNVYLYTDYEAFLKDMLVYLKSRDKNISMRSLSIAAGLSPGYIPIVFRSSQQLAHKSLEKIIPLLHLTPSEGKFLRLLRDMAEPSGPEHREDVLRRLQRSATFKREHTADFEIIKFLESWHNIAIRELAHHPEFKPDPQWIQPRLQFSVGLADIQDSLTFLFDEGFLALLPDGKVQVTAKQLDCRDEIYKMALITSHRQFFNLADEAMMTIPRSERKILGISIAMDDEGYQKAQQILEKALLEISEIEPAKGKSIRVANFGLVAFPLSKSEAQ